MAEASVSTEDKDDKVDEAMRKMFETAPFIWNKKDKLETNKPEVARNVDNLYSKAAERLVFKVACVGPFGGRWSKGVFIEDYTSPGGTINENPNNCPVIGVDFRVKNLKYKSGQKIRLQIWNLSEQERYFSDVLCCRHRDGVIVFWSAREHSMDTVLEYKDKIRRTFPTVPILLLIDNVFKQPVEWIGQGLLMNSTEEMDNFCLEHGFFTWFEMRERGAGKDSDFGRAMSKLVDAMNGKYEPRKPIAGRLRRLLLALGGNVDNSSAEEELALKVACNGAGTSTLRREVYIEDYTSPSGRTRKHKFRHLYNKCGKTVSLDIWNQHEDQRGSSSRDVRCGNGDGAVVFWNLNSDSMVTVLKYKNEIRRSFPTVPILLLIDNVLKKPVKWIGQGLVMNSTKEMDNFCLEHGFFTWFEMRERGAGEDSDFGRAMSKLVYEIIACMNN